MKELTNINFRRYKWRLPALIALLVVVVAGSFWLNTAPFRSGFEITDELGGNIFPSSILSVATTDAQVIVPADSLYVGNSKSCISIRIRSGKAYSRVRIEVAETPFFSRSVSEFVLAKPRTEYTIYPDIIWNYEALKNNNQAEPVSVAVKVEMNDKDLHQQVLHFLGVVHILKSHINLPDCRRTSEPVPLRTYATRAGRQPYGDGCTRSSGRPCRGPARRC